MEKNNVNDIVRIATSKKPTRVDITKVDLDPTLNVREPDVSTWNIPAMAEDLALSGQKEPILLEKIGERYRPWRGFRRTAAVMLNAEQGRIDPATGEKFNAVLAFVIDQELSEKERIALLLDAGNTQALSKVELFYAAEKADRVWDSDAQISIALRGLLDIHYPVRDPEVAADAKRYADYRRGIIGNLLQAARSPIVVRNAYVDKLKRKQSWPSDAEVRTLFRIFKREMEADSSRRISRSNPGPEFLKAWAEFTKKKAADAKAGRKPKSQAMMNQDDISTVQGKLESRTLKIVLDIVRRVKSQEHLATLDALMVDAEAGRASTQDFAAVLDSITASDNSVEEEEAAPTGA